MTSIAITSALVEKLISISQDIKVYVNTHAGLASIMTDSSGKSVHQLMTKSEFRKLINIRTSIKKLARQLEDRNP